MDDVKREQRNWERVAVAAYAQAGIAIEQAQLARTGRTLRRLNSVFANAGLSTFCAESFASILEELVRD
jgi:hypothetical protein